MAVTQNTYTGNGSTTNYSFTFPYLDTADIKVSVNGTPTTAYTLANATTVSFNSAPANGAAVRIYRETDDAALAATFYPGSAIRSQDLNDNFTQNLYVTQEVVNNAFNIDGSNTMLGNLDMGGQEIINIGAATTASSLVTKGYVDGYINTYYLGGSASNPTTRPGGSPLQAGDYYVNTSDYQFRYYNGSQWRDVDYATEQDRIAAQTARTEAETARTGAQTAQTASETAQAGSVAARSAAETAKAGAEAAQSGAITAKGLAESARDAALVNANIYANTAAGLAATAVGNYFKTYSGNTGSFLDLYRVDAGPIATLISTYPSKAFFSFFESDAGYDEFYSYAWTDSQYRLSMGVKPNGIVRIEKGDIGTLSVSSITAPGGSIDLDSVDTPLVNIADGGSLDGDLTYNDFYQLVETDSNNRISRAVSADGTNYFPKLSSDSLSVSSASIGTLNVSNFVSPTAVHGADGIFAVEAVSGTSQIIRYSNGIRTQLTTIGANTAPSLTLETPARILFSSTRTGVQSYQVMKTDGSRLAHAIAPKNTTIWGDSMTAFLGTTPLANALGDGRRIISFGYGGKGSVFIAQRQGGYPATGTISGAQIPASGSVSVTGLNAPVDSGTTTFSCSVNGISGTLDYNGGSPIFTRSAAGPVAPVTNPVTFVPILDDVVSGVTYHACEYTSILWLGRNGVGGAPGDTDVSVYTSVINEIRNLSKRILILPIFNGGYGLESNGDPAIPTAGTSGYDTIMSRNASIAAAFPQYWYDIRRDFIDGAEAWLQTNYPAVYASDWTQAFPSKQQAGLGPDSAWDVANDVPPRALRADNIHLNSYGNEFIGQLLATKLQSLGW